MSNRTHLPEPRPDPAPPLRLTGVSRRFVHGDVAVQALRDISLTVEAGELVAVMGPSGSGKSTLVRVACGLLAHDEGVVEIDGESVGSSSLRWAQLRRRRIGVVFQRLNLVPSLTAVENVMAPLLLDGARIAEARDHAMSALSELGIDLLATMAPADLSGGQEQKVAIARAIVGQRGLLLTDEPTGALDSVTSDDVIRLLASRAAAGAAVVLVTHDASLASWADRVIWLRDGSISEPAIATRPPNAPSGGVR
jgi:putative ABC transport system ATP-binding protein